MARPHTPDDQRKRRHVRFRLTEAEYLRLEQRAAAAGFSPHELARALTLLKVEHLVVEAQAGPSPAVLKQLHFIGHNINQLVKNAHIFGRVSPRIEHLCQRIEVLMDEVIGKEMK